MRKVIDHKENGLAQFTDFEKLLIQSIKKFCSISLLITVSGEKYINFEGLFKNGNNVQEVLE